MEIKRQPAVAQAPRNLQANTTPQAELAGGPTEQVTVGQPSAEEATAVLQQMATARQQVGQQLIGEVLEPSPPEYQEVAQATMPLREEIARYINQQTGAPTDGFYLLATETKMLSQAAVNAENRADFQAAQGLTPDRNQLFEQELGFLAEASIYQNSFAPEQLAQLLPETEVTGEAALSAGTFIQEVRRHVPAETAQQITDTAHQGTLFQVFAANPDLQKRFVGALDQNHQAALQVTQGCLGYFQILGQIMQNEMQAGQVLAAFNQQQA
jgi:hypothetical protein